MSADYGDYTSKVLVQDALGILAELQQRLRSGEGPKRVTSQQREAYTRTRALLADWRDSSR